MMTLPYKNKPRSLAGPLLGRWDRLTVALLASNLALLLLPLLWYLRGSRCDNSGTCDGCEA